MKHNIYIILLLPMLLASCGIYTKYEKVDAVPENLFGVADSIAVDTAGMAAMPWRELFTDPMLQNLIDEGLHNNSDLGAAQLRIDEAEATLRSARLALLPSFALAPQGTISSFDGGKATKAYSLPLTASWELDVFGRMRNARKQANALYQQSIDYKQAVHSQLVAGIANTYYTLLMLDSQLQIATDTRQSWQNTVESTQALVDAGMANSSAVDQMMAATQGIDITILDLKEQINQAENSMAKLLHSSPRHIERSSLDVQTMPDNVAIGLPIDILSHRPDVRAAERQLEQAFYG
ncbi:MAG: TolC family protein, partial [Muribaculaceae bacterium]